MAKKVEKKEKGFCGIKGLTEDLLIAAAEDLNASLGLDPAIDVEDLEGEELLEAVKVSMEEVYTQDQLEDDTWKVMELLGIEAQEAPEEGAPEEEEKPKAKGKGKKAPAVEPEDDDEAPAPKATKKGKKAAEPDDDDDEAPAPKKGKKPVKAAEPEDDDDDDDEAPAPKKGKAAPAEKKAAPKKANDGPKYSRSDAFGETLMAGKKDKKSLAQIIEDSDALYSEHTGRRSNTKEAAWCANLSLKALAACGYVKVDGDKVEILVRP